MKWNNEEIQFLINNHNILYADEMAKQLNRTTISIYKKCHKLNIPIKTKHKGSYNKPTQWTNEQIEFLKNNYTQYSNSLLSYLLKDKSVKRIKSKLKELNLNEERQNLDHLYFSQEEIDFIKYNYTTMTDLEIANYINKNLEHYRIRTTKTICLYRKNILKLTKEKHHIIRNHKENHWSEDETQFLMNNLNNMTVDELSIVLKRTKSSVVNKIKKLHLKPINTNGVKWLNKDLNYLKDNFDKYPINKIILDLQIPIEKILAKALELNLVYVIPQLTTPEIFIKKCLQELNIDFICQYKINYFHYNKKRWFFVDFIVGNHVIIEVQGDYWHCNPIIYPNGPTDIIQINNINNDNWKKEKLKDMGYEVIYIWENEIKNNPQKIKDYLASLFGNK